CRKASAMACPSPLVPPVTSATLPAGTNRSFIVPSIKTSLSEKGFPAGGSLRLSKVLIRPRRRTCADGGDTDREIYPKIVCEAKGRVRGSGVNFVEEESKGGNRPVRQ